MSGGSLHTPVAALIALCAMLGLGCSDGGPCARQTSGTVCPVAGTGQLGFNDDGQPPHRTDFFLVSRARRGPDELLYFADFNNWRVRRLGEDGRVHTVVGNGFHGVALADTPGTESPLENPIDMAFHPDGRLFILSPEDPRVIALDDGIVRVVAGTRQHGIRGDEGDGGDARMARFIQLEGVAIAEDGTTYLSDSKANRVRVIRDGTVSTLAGTGDEGYSGDGGPAAEAALHNPTALAFDGTTGDLYVADTLNHVVRKVSADGVIDTVAGSGEAGLSGDGGPAVEARLDEPNGVAVAEDGTLFIADRSNFRVRRVTPDGTIDTIAGTDEGYSGDGGPADEAQFGYLSRITLDRSSLLVADQSNGCVRRVHLQDGEGGGD